MIVIIFWSGAKHLNFGSVYLPFLYRLLPDILVQYTHISVRLLVIWDGSPIHRCQAIKAFLASPAGPGAPLEQLPGDAPELNPDEGVWNYLKRVELQNIICQHLGQLSYELGKAIERLRQKPHIIRACIAQAGLV